MSAKIKHDNTGGTSFNKCYISLVLKKKGVLMFCMLVLHQKNKDCKSVFEKSVNFGVK